MLSHFRDAFGPNLKTDAAKAMTEAAEAFQSLPEKPLRDLVKDLQKSERRPRSDRIRPPPLPATRQFQQLSALFAREDSFRDQLHALANSMKSVDGENVNRGPANRCASDQNWPAPTKMAVPFLTARIEQPSPSLCLWIDAREIRAFMMIVGKASQC